MYKEKRFEKITRVSNEVDSAIYGLDGPFFMGHHRLQTSSFIIIILYHISFKK